MPKLIDLTGQEFGNLTVLKMDRIGKVTYCECLCKCGKHTKPRSVELRNGHSKSCGCLRGKCNITHNMVKTRPHRIWNAMKQRCSNSKTINYHNYGGKGIKVCDRWLTFENFWEDMKETYADNLTLDRKDSELGYNKDNCRWATPKEQASNTRVNHLIEYNGETKTMTQWAEFCGIDSMLFLWRIRKGWSIEDAITRKVRKLNRKKKNLTS